MNKNPITIPLKCKCGAFHGEVQALKPSERSRYTCHCDDCQAYMHFLGRGRDGLDKHGGTDIVATLPSRFKIYEGQQHLRALRLTENGIYRWFAACCNTPIGNLRDPKMPYIGIVHTAIDWPAAERDRQLGPIKERVMGKFATNPPLPKDIHPAMPIRVLMDIAWKMLQWWLKGGGKTSTFFVGGRPTVATYVLSREERYQISGYPVPDI